jgi:hypothetical protein
MGQGGARRLTVLADAAPHATARGCCCTSAPGPQWRCVGGGGVAALGDCPSMRIESAAVLPPWPGMVGVVGGDPTR